MMYVITDRTLRCLVLRFTARGEVLSAGLWASVAASFVAEAIGIPAAPDAAVLVRHPSCRFSPTTWALTNKVLALIRSRQRLGSGWSSYVVAPSVCASTTSRLKGATRTRLGRLKLCAASLGKNTVYKPSPMGRIGKHFQIQPYLITAQL